jgi:serine/threonine protein kinase
VAVRLTRLLLTLKHMPATNELLQEGRYRISQSTSDTGTEKVFEAYDTVRNTNVIVREIPVKLNRVATVSQRESLKLAFANQAKALTEIQHEAVLPVQDYFSEIDRQYLVTEAVEGNSLSDLVAERRKPFTVEEVTRWADELLDALSYLHSRKPPILHRNINPANVALHPSGKIKLVGLGVENGFDPEYSTVLGDGDDLHYSPMEQIWPGLDAASQKAITNNYDDRSERILKQPLDERSDIYSLGATLYFLITGVEPVDPIERSIEMLEGKLDPLREPTKVDPSIPAEISDVLMKALEIKRENRYDAAVIMRQVLSTAISRVQDQADGEAREHLEAVQARNEASEAAIAEEKRKQAEADAEHKRQAELLQQQQLRAAEEKRLAAEAEQQRQNEVMQQQLREEEARRLEAERAAAETKRVEAERVAEAQRLARETEAAKQAAAKPKAEEALLDIPVAAAPEVVAYRENSAVEEAELAAVLRELEEAEEEAARGERTESHEALADDPDVSYEHAVDLGAQPATDHVFAGHDEPDEKIFSVEEKTGSSMPMPAVAGGIVLVVVLAIGGWFVMSGSKEQPKPAPAPTVQVAQPAPVQEAPAADTIVSTHTDTNSAAVETPADQVTVASKTAPAAKPKKTDAAKAPEKKKVTVDDLINDN